MRKRRSAVALLIVPALLGLTACEEASPSEASLSSSETEVTAPSPSTYDEEAVELACRFHAFPFGEGQESLLSGVEPSDIAMAEVDIDDGLTPTYFGYASLSYPMLKLLWAGVAYVEMPAGASSILPGFDGKRLEIVFQSYSRWDYFVPPADTLLDGGMTFREGSFKTLSITDGESLLFLSEWSANSDGLDELYGPAIGLFEGRVSTGGLFALLDEPFVASYEISAALTLPRYEEGGDTATSFLIESFDLLAYQGGERIAIPIGSCYEGTFASSFLIEKIGSTIEIEEGGNQ